MLNWPVAEPSMLSVPFFTVTSNSTSSSDPSIETSRSKSNVKSPSAANAAANGIGGVAKPGIVMSTLPEIAPATALPVFDKVDVHVREPQARNGDL